MGVSEQRTRSRYGPCRPLAFVLAGGLFLAGARPVGAQGNFVANGEQSQPVYEEGETTVDWYWWWHLNKDAYLRLRERVFELAPRTGRDDFFVGNGERIIERDPNELTSYELRVLTVPSILAALEEDPGDGLIQAALFALAKIGTRGELPDGDTFREIIGDYLDHTTKSVRVRAVMALGILGSEDSIPTLVDLLHNSPHGQRIAGRTEVEREVRSYAAYALGLIGARSTSVDVRRGIMIEIVDILDGPKFATRDIKIACVSAMGLLPLEVTDWEPPGRRINGVRPPPPDPMSSRRGQIRYLLEYLRDRRSNLDPIRSHTIAAMARLVEGEDDRTFVEVLDGTMRILRRYSSERDIVQQAAVLALGQFGDADEDVRDRKIVDTLIRMVDRGDQQARRYAMISLGKIAGRPGAGIDGFGNQKKIINFLRRQMGARGESRVRAWSALGLGVMMRQLRDLRLPLPEEPLQYMRKALKECFTPLDIGAYSLALGLARDVPSLEHIQEKLTRFEVETPRGLILLSMGMLQDRKAVEPLLEELRDVNFRGERMAFASIALALAGSSDRVPVLLEKFQSAGSQASQGPIVASLGVSGDRRIIYPLSNIVRNTEEYTEAVRTAAIVGLGNVADKDLLLWRTKYSTNVNYRSTPTTFLSPGNGILNFY